MRIKWNRHLDGSSSRRPEDEETAGTQESDEKKRGSAAPSIFKIFRRKKNRRKGEQDDKVDENNGIASPLEANDDDCASVSSITTCASQPVTEGFQRDRASSLFSSFRLSLPGSKRKKRKIAPTPSETLLNEQQNEPQIDRYSTPDLRKPVDKLHVGSNAQVSLSTSSPSIRNPKGTSTSAQSLDVAGQNSESLDKLKWSNTKSVTSSSSKLSKSVSFSDCKDGFADSPHSTTDNKAPRAVNSTAMVEEDPGAFESELPACLSDNLRMSRESKFTAVDSLDSTANVSNPQKEPRNEAVEAEAVMTKIETTTSQVSENTGGSAFNVIGDILNDISTEIQSYELSNDKGKNRSVNSTLEASSVSSANQCDSPRYFSDLSNETNADIVHDSKKKDKRYEVRVDLKKYPSVQCIGTDVSVPEQNIEKYVNNEYNTILYPEKNGDIGDEPRMDNSSDTKSSLNTKLEVLSSELSLLTTAHSLSNLNSCDATRQHPDDEIGDVCDTTEGVINGQTFKYESSDNSVTDNCNKIPSGNHVVCHMTIYENKSFTQKSDDSKVISKPSLILQNPVIEKSSENKINNSDLPKETLFNTSQYKPEITDISNVSVPTSKSYFDSINRVPFSKYDDSVTLNSCSENGIAYDQKVPYDELIPDKNNFYQNDQQVPEFELSLLEFEEVCNKYMSRSNPELSDSDSTIPLYSNSPKRKSVLDMNFSFTYSNFQDNCGNSDLYFRNSLEKDKISSPSHNGDLIQQDVKTGASSLQNSCQSLRNKYQLPSPPKQWTNCEKPIDIESNRDVCIDGVQCTTKVHGKNLCQEPCLEALPTTVMLDDSNLGGIDTPQLSSTTFENKSGRELSSCFTGEKRQVSDNRTPSEDMISNVGLTIASLSSVLDYSLAPESSGKTSVFLDSEIRDTFRGPRAICDPLVYSSDVSKGLESLGSESYLNGHNFCDIRNVGFCEVINDLPRDYVQAGLIEISNPYEDTFILSQDLSNRNLVNGATVSLTNGHSSAKVDHTSIDITEISIPEKLDSQEIESSKVNSVDNHPETENSSIDGVSDLKTPISNGNEHFLENKIELKNLKNNKHSMIPCRKKGIASNENKKIETKSKSKKNNSHPRFNKNESHLPLKNNSSSHRVFSKSSKDSSGEQSKRKQKDLSVNNKLNGNCSDITSANINSEILETREFNSNLQHDNSIAFEDSVCYAAEENKIPRALSSSMVESSNYSDNFVSFIENDNSNSSAVVKNDQTVQKNELDDSKSALSTTSIPSIRDFEDSPIVLNSNISECAVSFDENNDAGLIDEICPECLNLDIQDHMDISSENGKYQYCSNHLDYMQHSRRSSLSAFGLRKTSFASSKESLSSQMTNSSNRGKSRIPQKQPSTRGAHPSAKGGPVRPPMWLSKAELTKEIQRLGTLCEARTKELNRLKMETKHVSVGFDAFAALFKYMVEDLNGLSVPALTEDLKKTLKQLELTKQDLAYYEREVEEMKSHHCQELNDLSNKLFEVYQSEVAELNAKHQEEINHLKTDHQKEIEHLTTTFDTSSNEAKAQQEKIIANLEQEIHHQREELQEFQEREIRDLEEKHVESSKLLQDHIEQLQKKCAELKQHSMSMEDALRKDTDSKLQWVTSAKLDLEKEVESLKAVLEMKNKELHSLRVQNLEMEKQLEELPLAREKIKMLQARAEDLEALLVEKTKIERTLSTENQQMRDTYEKETKVNRRLSMENEELQWRLRQAENSLISGSFTEVPEFPETEENASATASSPTKSPGPQVLARSVFFTFVDKDENIPHSPRSQYKKITPNFSSNYKTSPAKSSRSPPAPSPRRGKSHSEPPQPPHTVTTSTPRKVAKLSLGKTKGPNQKCQRSGSDSARPGESAEVTFTSLNESMASSVSSESSVFEHRERLLEDHKEHIIHSLEILREQRSAENSVHEQSVIEKKWCSDDIKITGQLSNLETEDMSRSAEFSDPKTYYHMTFPVLKESGTPDGDIEDSKNSSTGNSPMKEIAPNAIHSMSENNILSAVEASETIHVMSQSTQEVSSSTRVVGNKTGSCSLSPQEVTTIAEEEKSNNCPKSSMSAENVQKESTVVESEKPGNRWRTI